MPANMVVPQERTTLPVLADVNIALHGGSEGGVMDSTCLLAHEAWLEQHLRTAEALTANCDNVAIGKLVGLLLVGTLSCFLHLCVEIQCNVGQLLLDIAHNFTLSRCGEGITTLSQDLHEVLCQI